MKRTTRDRPLTPDEAEKYQSIRDAVQAEKSEISERVRQKMTEKRSSPGSSQGPATIVQQIRSAREARGDSQVALASAAGISPEQLSQFELDQQEPTLSVAARLAAALHISLDELASGVA